jgi:tetratricopeptide (TPR) repeat protein
VLDGLESVQHRTGPDLGLLVNGDLRQLLSYLASGYHYSMCILTSRLPVLDLYAYASFIELDVGRLTSDEGVELLESMNVKVNRRKLRRIVDEWEGHAFALTLIASFLTKHPRKLASRLQSLAVDLLNETPSKRLDTMLNRYHAQLTPARRTLLSIFCACRRSVPPQLVEYVSRDAWPPETEYVTCNAATIKAALPELIQTRLLREVGKDSYNCHPLVRGFYLVQVQDKPDAGRTLHMRIRDYYSSQKATTEPDTFEALAPIIEAVHHCCRAGAYDDDAVMLKQFVYFEDRRTLVNRFGAYDSAVEIFEQFFPENKLDEEPLISDSNYRVWMFEELGLSFMSLGRLKLASPFFERQLALSKTIGNRRGISSAYQNFAELFAYRGDLVSAEKAAADAITSAPDDLSKCFSLSRRGWAMFLQGKTAEAHQAYEQANELQKKLYNLDLYH